MRLSPDVSLTTNGRHLSLVDAREPIQEVGPPSPVLSAEEQRG